MKKNFLEDFRQKRNLNLLREQKIGNKKSKKKFIVLIFLLLILSSIFYFLYTTRDNRTTLVDLKNNKNIQSILGDNATILRCEIIKKGVLFNTQEAYFDVAYLKKDTTPIEKEISEKGEKLFEEVKKQYPVKKLYFYTYDKKDIKVKYGERNDNFKFEYIVSKDKKSDTIYKTIGSIYSNNKINFFKDVEKDPNILDYKYLSLREYNILNAKFINKNTINITVFCQLKDGLAYDDEILYFLQQLSHEVKKLNSPKVENINLICEDKVSEDAYGKKLDSYIVFSTKYPTSFKYIKTVDNIIK